MWRRYCVRRAGADKGFSALQNKDDLSMRIGIDVRCGRFELLCCLVEIKGFWCCERRECLSSEDMLYSI